MRVALLDDVAVGTASTYGAPCATPTADRFAVAGLRFIRFHTTAPCSPKRAAVLSGRIRHAVGTGGIAQRVFRGTTGRNEHSVIATKHKARTITDSAVPQPDSSHIIKERKNGWEHSVDGGSRLGQGASVTMLADDSPVTIVHVDHTQSPIFLGTIWLTSASMTDRTSRTGGRNPTAASAGEIKWVQVEPEYASQDHFISAEDRLKLAVARQ